MPRQGRSFLIIPPKKFRVRYIRVRFGVIIAILILSIISIAGYFIPTESIHLTSEEIIRKRHLAKENNKLLAKINSIKRMLVTLGKELDTLSITKHNVSELLDTKQKKGTLFIDPKYSVFAEHKLDDLIDYANKEEKFIKQLTKQLDENRDISNSLPLTYPIKGEYTISAEFGNMQDPFTSIIKWHNGIDFSTNSGVNIIAPANGTVIKTNVSKLWGNRVVIKHKFGFKTVYAHLNTIKVKTNSKIKRGDVIGTVGTTGLSTGPHLHYEVLKDGKNIDPGILFFKNRTSTVALSTMK